MIGMSGTPSSAALKRCPFFKGRALPESTTEQSQAGSCERAGDTVSISPFEPADSGPLSKTCVSSAAKATFPMLPVLAKAGCPHAA